MKKINEPSFYESLKPTRLSELSDEHRQDNLSFEDEAYTDGLDAREFYECTFTKIDLTSHCRRTLFVDTIFENCDFSNADFRECVFRRVIFKKCRLTGIDLSLSTFEDVKFLNIQGQYANFSGAKMKSVLFSECILSDSAFSMCKMKEIELDTCDFTNAEFIDTRLSGIDFSSSNISGISFTTDNLKGIILNEDQAIACAKLLGIIVK